MEEKLKTVCSECFHPHRWKKFCHVFSEGLKDALLEEEDEESLGRITFQFV
jgi:hypothetical protein